MRRRLSSYQTFLIKLVLPLFWIPVFGIVTIIMFVHSFKDPVTWVFMIFFTATSAFSLWESKRLKEVSVDENFLYASNYLKEIAIPLSDIYDVTENFWLNTHPVTIHLKSPTEFGDKIVFMPTSRVWGFSSHPVVAELKQLAKSTVAHR